MAFLKIIIATETEEALRNIAGLDISFKNNKDIRNIYNFYIKKGYLYITDSDFHNMKEYESVKIFNDIGEYIHVQKLRITLLNKIVKKIKLYESESKNK